jgi:hypothetical protein
MGSDIRTALERLPDTLAKHVAYLRGEPEGIRADLRDADLRGAFLRGADLCDAIGLTVAADAPTRLRDVAAVALASDDALQMGEWHCGTAHCIAGWAIHQAGEAGRLLESAVGPEIAGLMLLGTEAHKHFFDSNEEARAYLIAVLDSEVKA